MGSMKQLLLEAFGLVAQDMTALNIILGLL
nr:MAG TPA: hypothetical protein [Caudoviricetes sp.]